MGAVDVAGSPNDADIALGRMAHDCLGRGCALYDGGPSGAPWIGHGFPPLGNEAGWQWQHLPYDDQQRPAPAVIDDWRMRLHLDRVVPDP